MKNFSLTPVCLVAAIGLGAWGFWEHTQRTRLEGQLRATITERDTLKLTADQKISFASKTAVKPGGPEGLGPENAEALRAEQESGKKPEKATEPNGLGSDFAKMLKDPAMREGMKAQMRGQMDYLYRDFMDLLNLPEQKREQLTRLLVERADSAMAAGLAAMSGNTPDGEEKKAAADSIAKMTAESEKALKELLGEEDFTKLERFDKSQPERMALNNFSGSLKEAGMELSPEAETQLMDAMYEERTQFKFDNDMGNQKNTDMSRFTPENIQRFQEQSATLRAGIMERASKILSPEQLGIFQKSQEQKAAMEKAQLDMALKMFQPQKKDP